VIVNAARASQAMCQEPVVMVSEQYGTVQV
jgi:hypothetical protein